MRVVFRETCAPWVYSVTTLTSTGGEDGGEGWGGGDSGAGVAGREGLERLAAAGVFFAPGRGAGV